VSYAFDLRAVYDAMDARRRARQLTWAAVGDEVNRLRTWRRPIAVSTITGLRDKPSGEGDGILQMLMWLRRTPESFVRGMADPKSDRFVSPNLAKGQILRWDTGALHGALNAQRLARGLSWPDVARELPGFTPGMLTTLAKGGRIGFPRVMRLVAWLGQPAARFTHVSDW
jgi:hypothetical protein